MEANVEEQMKAQVEDQMKAVGAVGASILAFWGADFSNLDDNDNNNDNDNNEKDGNNSGNSGSDSNGSGVLDTTTRSRTRRNLSITSFFPTIRLILDFNLLFIHFSYSVITSQLNFPFHHPHF